MILENIKDISRITEPWSPLTPLTQSGASEPRGCVILENINDTLKITQPWSQLTPLLVWGSYIWIIPAVFTHSFQILIVSGFRSKLCTNTAGILLCIIWNKAKYYARVWRLCWWPVARPGDLVLSWAALEADTGLYWATVEPDQPPHLEARWAQLDWGMEPCTLLLTWLPALIQILSSLNIVHSFPAKFLKMQSLKAFSSIYHY